MTQWLPGTTRNRIQDLCRDRNITQSELAQQVEIDKSTLSRFLNEKTNSLSEACIIRIAEYFKVSTDFLLGVTDTVSLLKPRLMCYNISGDENEEIRDNH